jgi:hypothetical protein
MNVTFHVLAGIGVAAVLIPREPPISVLSLLTGLGATAALHGLLDFVPHSYPIKSGIDVMLALLVFGTALSFAKPHVRLLLVVCFLGSILPDLIDLGPGILNRRAGLNLPDIKFFPWHWKQYSGSVYDGSRTTESAVLYLLVLTIATAAVLCQRDRFVK